MMFRPILTAGAAAIAAVVLAAGPALGGTAQASSAAGSWSAPAALPAGVGTGATLRDVQDYAGHKDPRTTRRYDHARDSLDRNAAYAVAAYLA
jgi:hypothetical protein